MIQIIRDSQSLDNKYCNSFVKALNNEANDKYVHIETVVIYNQQELESIDWNIPTIIVEPFLYIIPKQYNNADLNATAEVCSDIAKSIKGYSSPSILIINRSELIGKPLSNMLLDNDFTVSIAHSKTASNKLNGLIEQADIIISATGNDISKYIKEYVCFKTIIDVSNDLKSFKGRCLNYYSMSDVGKLTVKKIIHRCK